eukprot:CAMPEP_0201693704 /NCGR_PEP_ID=MMETSP0578-20130828/6208_1 /ASSEMBLY_ACC=CAM_ASM_000663 /TAXON_ID=267565 /ORGANISM="Skeletonema grethea, Strain CCMP 1804" /LENGTH=398 /DNA_ID=CAMNT_0048179275 /DNA_START=83 /DNA_END=1279 /DNA_ORIENTATION=+
MLGVRSSRLSRRGRPDASNLKVKNVMFYSAHIDAYSVSPTSTTSCETSLESSTYMEDQPFDCIELSPSVSLESTSSSQSKLMQESVLKSNKYCGSAYVKARKQRQEMKDVSIQYDDPPLDHLLLLGPSLETRSPSFQSKLVKEATLIIKQRHSADEEVSPFGGESSPPLPLQSTLPTPTPWPQSNWKTGPSKTNTTQTAKLHATRPSMSVRDSIVNNIKAKSTEVTPMSNNRSTRERKVRHIDQVKAKARNRKEQNETTNQQQNDPDTPKSTKSSNSFKDFVDHLLTVNASNQLCRSPTPTQTLPSASNKKKVSWKGGDPNLPKPILRRRSNSPTTPNLPKPVLKRGQHHFTQRFSSSPISTPTAPFDFDDFVSSPPGGWKSVLLCGGSPMKKVYDSP